jgi:hypothetical protein
MSNGSGAPAWISASAVGSTNTYFAGNGLSLASNTFKLGGLLSQNTDIGFSGFNLTFSDGGSTFASFSAAGNTFYNPTSFTSAGDVSIAYDLNFTNSTVSTIRSNSNSRNFFEPRVYKRYKRCFRIKRNFKRNRYIYTKQIRK